MAPKKKSAKFKTSLGEIARLANTSTTTVSLVLNNKAKQYRISQKTQDKVNLLAKQLNYVPNPSARNLRLKKTQTIGLVITDLSNYFFTQLARYLEQVCRENGYLLQISASEDNVLLEEQIIHNFILKSVDGLIIASVHQNSEFLTRIAEATPTVFIDRRVEGAQCSWVESNNFESAQELIRHLVIRQPREIGYIGGIKDISSNAERLRAYRSVLREFNIPADKRCIIQKDFTADAGYQSMIKLVNSLGRLPDALFTASFTLLEGVLRALKERHSSLPNDINIGTYDDHPLLDFTTLKIHSVQQDYQSIARKAFHILMDHLQGTSTVQRETVPAKVLFRE